MCLWVGGGRTDDVKRRAQATYNSAAECFDDPAFGFWDRFGRATVERLDLRDGASVLDACAGSGASAVPAALRVGPTGKVVAVDLADKLLALARAKADRLGLRNLETRHADIEALDYPPGAFDAVIIVFGVQAATARRSPSPYRAERQLAVTTWGPRLFEPANSLFWDMVDRVRPDLNRAYQPWDSLTDPDAVRALLAQVGADRVQAEAVSDTHTLRSPPRFLDDRERQRLSGHTRRAHYGGARRCSCPHPRGHHRSTDHDDRDERHLRDGNQADLNATTDQM